MSQQNYTKINSTLEYTEYLNDDGKFHRLNGPAFEWLKNHFAFPGHSFWVNGKRHRIGGPSNLVFYNQKILEQLWYKNNLCHRLNAPAEIFYNDFGKTKVFFYEFGKQIKST
jgi:hypothetical protein